VSPIFVGLIVVMGASGAVLFGGSDNEFLLFVFVLAGWVVSLCLHEFSHAYVAHRSGDDSVAERGYLSLDPRRYTDPVLSIALPVLFVLLGGIGLPGGAVWIDRSAIKQRRQLSLVSVAGPAANVVLAAVLLAPVGLGWIEAQGRGVFVAAVVYLGFLQIAAAVLNLLPVPGLDGYGIVEPYLPPSVRRRLEPVRSFGLLVLFLLLWQVEPINEAFWNTVYRVLELFGVDRLFALAGFVLFRFWE
jgi:Zn-dependent protease